MTELNVCQYPKFVDLWVRSMLSLEHMLSIAGCKTAEEMPKLGHVMISEEEFTWFVLRWS